MILFAARKPRAPRRKVGKPAWVVFDGDFALRPCTVIEMSEEGARLDLAETGRLPRHFRLTFSRATRNGMRCEVRWKHGHKIGVKFVA